MTVKRDSLARWISVLYRYGQMHHARALAPLGIGPGQVAFLAALYHNDGLSQDDLAERLHIDKGTTCRALTRLEESGYIVRECDELDRRVKRIRLTPKAAENRSSFFATLRSWNEALLAGISDTERDQIMDVVHRLAENARRATQPEEM